MTRRYQSFIDDSARWERLSLRDDDIIVTTPAKSGTTWMQMCCALLIFQRPQPPAPLAVLSPWLDMLTWSIDDVVALLDAQPHRRFIKTHTPLDGLPWHPKVTYLCVGRDPRDVAVSMVAHMRNMDLGAVLEAREKAVGVEDLDLASLEPPPLDVEPAEKLRGWIESDDDHTQRSPGLASLLEHLHTYWVRKDEPNVALFHYADLQRDLPGQLRRLAGVLGIDVPDHRWDELVGAASFESMKAHADHLAPDTVHHLWKDNAQFFHRGQSGQWRELLDDEDEARYEARVAQLCDDEEFVRWVHDGWGAS